MPFAILLIVGLVVYNSGVIDKVKESKKEIVAEVATQEPTIVKQPTTEKLKPILKLPEPIKEEVKIEVRQPEPAKEVAKSEIKQPEPTKEAIKTEIKQPELVKELEKEESKAEPGDTTTEEFKVDESDNNYLKIILYIVGAIATIFGGFYFFSNRGSSQSTASSIDVSRKDIEESYQPETQEQQSTQEETQTETQEQQSVQEETQTETQEQQSVQEEAQTETQEQQSVKEEAQTENQEQQTNEDEENNNK